MCSDMSWVLWVQQAGGVFLHRPIVPGLLRIRLGKDKSRLGWKPVKGRPCLVRPSVVSRPSRPQWAPTYMPLGLRARLSPTMEGDGGDVVQWWKQETPPGVRLSSRGLWFLQQDESWKTGGLDWNLPQSQTKTFDFIFS